ncbi:MAG: diguanylate cyclase [Bacillota bacterium]
MKLRTRFQLYISLTGLIPLLCLLLGFVLISARRPAAHFAKGHLSLSLLGFLAAFIIGLIVIGISSSYFKSVLKRIKVITDYVRLVPGSNLPALPPDPQFDELGKLRQSLIDMFQRYQQVNVEFEAKYRKLLLANMNLEEKYAQSYTIQLVLEEIGRELDSDQLLKKTSDIILGVFGGRRCTIYMVDEEKECLVTKADSGVIDPSGENTVIPFDSEIIIARSWRSKRILTETEAKPLELKAFQNRGVQSFSIFPLTGRRGCLGVIVIEHQMADGLSPDLEDFAKLIAQEISLSVENAYLYEKMRHMANHDALTGAYNRMYLMNYMAEIFSKEPKMVSVIMFDMDHFKKVNDKYGHLAGDMVLKTAASLIQKMLPTGILGRYGGEEFVVILPAVDQEAALSLAESIRREIGDHDFITGEGVKVPVTISAGLASYPQVSDSLKGLLQLADEALYEAKNTGRNKVCVASAKGGNN